MGLISKAHELARFALDGHSELAIHAVKSRIYADATAIGLRRDLDTPFYPPLANLAFSVRPLRSTDDLSFLEMTHDVGQEETLNRFAQLRLIKSNLPTCYVAVADSGEVLYMQWLIAARENHQVLLQFGGQFPKLRPDEALLEGAYTTPKHRGKRIMARAMALIAEKAPALGARYVITFVGDGNEASIKGCRRSGFSPYVVRHESWRLLHRKFTFSDLQETTAA